MEWNKYPTEAVTFFETNSLVILLFESFVQLFVNLPVNYERQRNAKLGQLSFWLKESLTIRNTTTNN